MNVVFDKVALDEFCESLYNIRVSANQNIDACNNGNNECQQYYTRLHTNIEERVRKAYNQQEETASIINSFQSELLRLKSRLDSTNDEDERKKIQSEIESLNQRIYEANIKYETNIAEYNKISNIANELNSLWSEYVRQSEPLLNVVNDTFRSFIATSSNCSTAIEEFSKNMELAESALYDTNLSGSIGNENTSSHKNIIDFKQTKSSSEASSAKIVSERSNLSSFSVSTTPCGKELKYVSDTGELYNVPFTKSGIAAAYRLALKNEDTVAQETFMPMFSAWNSSSSEIENQKNIESIIAKLQAGLPQALNNETVIAGAQQRALNSPATHKGDSAIGRWENQVYYFNDDYVPEKQNENSLTIHQIKEELLNKYGLVLDGIPYSKGVADFSSISLANIPTEDIVCVATGYSKEEYKSFEQRKKVEILQDVFSDANDGKSKRNKNFRIADRIASANKIGIPELGNNYSPQELGEWRKKHKFSWDEQLNCGYNLVPSIIHANLSHTGLVSTSKNANSYLKQRDIDMKDNPEKYNWDESKAPISIKDLLELLK